MIQIAAFVFIFSTLIVILFQSALICGAPWGEWTMGGRWRGALPLHARLIAAFSLLLLVGFVLIIAAKAQLGFLALQSYTPIALWIIVGYSALACIANAATPSPRERRLWLPIVACMLASSLVVAIAE
jgi:hypothetical protein